MYRYNKYLFFFSLIGLLTCFLHRNDFPSELNISSFMADEPVQRVVNEEPFTVTFNDVDYLVEPLYEYELYGVLVSYAHHEGGSLHEKWNDHLNVSDFCVVWGSNTDSTWLNKINFWNGQFTCNFETQDQAAWQQFKPNMLSNNHLLSDDPALRKRLEAVNIGDQVRLKGYLSKYSNNSGFKRSTSTVRTDTGKWCL